jgi:hypothetical protein
MPRVAPAQRVGVGEVGERSWDRACGASRPGLGEVMGLW